VKRRAAKAPTVLAPTLATNAVVKTLEYPWDFEFSPEEKAAIRPFCLLRPADQIVRHLKACAQNFLSKNNDYPDAKSQRELWKEAHSSVERMMRAWENVASAQHPFLQEAAEWLAADLGFHSTDSGTEIDEITKFAKLFIDKMEHVSKVYTSHFSQCALSNEGKTPSYQTEYYDEVLHVCRFFALGSIGYSTKEESVRFGKEIEFFEAAVFPVLKKAGRKLPSRETICEQIRRYRDEKGIESAD
jgi:hypothetical protein